MIRQIARTSCDSTFSHYSVHTRTIWALTWLIIHWLIFGFGILLVHEKWGSAHKSKAMKSITSQRPLWHPKLWTLTCTMASLRLLNWDYHLLGTNVAAIIILMVRRGLDFRLLSCSRREHRWRRKIRKYEMASYMHLRSVRGVVSFLQFVDVFIVLPVNHELL